MDVYFTTIGEHPQTIPDKCQDELNQNRFHVNSEIDSALQSIDWEK